jgi:alpha(1,3/1,4) fucosyltransferase
MKFKTCMYIIIALFISLNAQKKIYLVPFSPTDSNETFFSSSCRDDCMKAFCDLKRACARLGYSLEINILENKLEDDIPTLLCNLPVWTDWPSKISQDPTKVFLFLWEPPTVMPYLYRTDFHQSCAKVFTFFDRLVDNKKYCKFYYPQPWLNMIDDCILFHEKKLCACISCNKKSAHPDELYSHRLSDIVFFEKNAPHEFDLYGLGWQNVGFKTYKGTAAHKVPILKQYKFSICYENMKNGAGYITEKIFDSFVAGCVPVYYGARNITDYIPQNCFIAREQFSTTNDLYQFLKNMSEDEYNSYLENIRNFFASDKALAFSIEHFIDTVLTAVLPGYDMSVVFSAEQCKLLERYHKH